MPEEFFIPTSLVDLAGPAAAVPHNGRWASEPPATIPGEVVFLRAELNEMRNEVQRLRSDRDRLAANERRIMELLNVSSSDRLVHDLRNVLNERALYRALVDLGERP